MQDLTATGDRRSAAMPWEPHGQRRPRLSEMQADEDMKDA